MNYVDVEHLTDAYSASDWFTIKSNIRDTMQHRNISPQEVSEALKVSIHTARAYKNLSHMSKPELKNLMLFSENFNIGIYEILGTELAVT